MPGHVELRTAKIWMEVKPGSSVELWYWKKAETSTAKKLFTLTATTNWFSPVVFDLVDLEMNTTYEYAVVVNKRLIKSQRKLMENLQHLNYGNGVNQHLTFHFLPVAVLISTNPNMIVPVFLMARTLQFLKRWQKRKRLLCFG